MNRRFPFVPTVICILVILVLCRLGIWQVERLAWKNNLQSELDMAFLISNPPVVSETSLKSFQKGNVVRGLIKGSFDPKKIAYFYGRIQGGRSSVSLVVPFEMDQSKMIVPIEIGCIEKLNPQILQSVLSQNILIKGIIRYPKSSFASPHNSPQKNEWWRFDPEQLGLFWKTDHVVPVVMTAENTTEISKDLLSCPIEKTLRNDHFSYAVFWFLMAGILAIMWGVRFLKPYLQSA